MDDIKLRQQELVEIIAEAAEELGWIIAIPQEGDGEELVQGLILGTEEFITNLVAQTEMQTEIIEFDSTPGTTLKKSVH